MSRVLQKLTWSNFSQRDILPIERIQCVSVFTFLALQGTNEPQLTQRKNVSRQPWLSIVQTQITDQ